MSVCGQTEEDSASEEAGGGETVREMYETKAVSKVVRVLTVLAYLLSVSLAAILLSVYYVCVWKSPELPPLNETEGAVAARRSHPHDQTHDYHVHDLHASFSYSGGSNISLSDELPTPDNVTSPVDSDPPTSPPSSPHPTATLEYTTNDIGTSTGATNETVT